MKIPPKKFTIDTKYRNWYEEVKKLSEFVKEPIGKWLGRLKGFTSEKIRSIRKQGEDKIKPNFSPKYAINTILKGLKK